MLTHSEYVHRIIKQMRSEQAATYTPRTKKTTEPRPTKEDTGLMAQVIAANIKLQQATASAPVKPTGERIAANITNDTSTPLTHQEPVKTVSMGDYVVNHPEYGIPLKSDVFHIVKIESNTYDCFTLPFEAGNKVYPVFMIANQNGDLMKTVSTDYKKTSGSTSNDNLDWFYQSHQQGGSEIITELLIKSIKLLKQWQRATYGKQSVKPESITLEATGSIDNFTITAKDLLSKIKSVSKSAYLNISGILFKAGTIIDLCKVSTDDTMKVKLEQAVQHTYMTDHNGYETVTIPALVIRHGNAKTTLRGTLATKIPASMQVVPCTL